MAAHTPGPLRVVVTTSGKWDETGDCAILDDEGKIIAETFRTVGPNGFIDRRPAEANARLFAASPELLAALVEVEWACYHGGADEYSCPSCGAVEKPSGMPYRGVHNEGCVLKAAIAKATGEAV